MLQVVELCKQIYSKYLFNHLRIIMWIKLKSIFSVHNGIALFLVFSHSLVLAQNPASTTLEEELQKLISYSQRYVVTVIGVSQEMYDEETVQSADPNQVPRSIIKPVLNKNVGSGLLVDSQGIVLTRSSIIRNKDQIYIRLFTGDEVEAEVLGEQPNEIAVLKIDRAPIENPSFSHDTGMRLGSWIYVMGTSYGYGPAVALGLVEGILDNGYVLIGARAWNGCSGAPVFNLNGQVVGILAAKMEVSRELKKYAGMVGHDEYVVVPIGSLLPRIAQVIDSKVQPSGWVGMTIIENNQRQGFFQISQIQSNSPASRAGIQIGDEVITFNETKVKSIKDIWSQIKNSGVNDSIKLELKRGNQVFRTNVKFVPRTSTFGQKD